MMRTILASAATIALTMGVAIGQELPPEAGLTPGAPLGADPYTDEGVVVGEPSIADQTAEPIPAEPVLAEPAPAAPAGIAQAPVAPGAPVALAYPDIPSSAGLTPGAPLGSDAITDRKVVAGEGPRAIGAQPIFR